MALETIKEKLCVNKLLGTKKETIIVEGDMIVPDSKPDILNTICTSGVECIYKKEILEGKLRLDGNIYTYIMYIPEDSQDKVRGITTNIDFSENIQMSNLKEGMDAKLESKLKSIETRVINGRKVSIKASIEIEIKIYQREDIELINEIPNNNGIQVLKENIIINSIIGNGETKIYAKENLQINQVDNFAEILKVKLNITNKDIKVSYNKILTKAEADIKLMYLTEDNRIGIIKEKIPIVGFIEIPNVNEQNTCEVNYEIRNIIIKPNSLEEHSVYIELEIGVAATVYEEKQINLIKDLYSPIENIQFNKKQIKTISNKTILKEIKQIREKTMIEGIDNKEIIDVDITPIIQKEHSKNSRIIYEGEIGLRFMLLNKEIGVEDRTINIPFDYSIDKQEDREIKMFLDIINQDFFIQDRGIVNCNIDMEMIVNSDRNIEMGVIEKIEENGEREEQDYSIIMYITKKGDTLWEIAKRFGSTVEDIVITNGIDNENKIGIGEKLYIPKYYKKYVNNYG